MTQGNSIAGPQRVGQEQPNTPPGNVDPRLVTAERIVVTGPQYHKGRLTHEGMRQVHAAGGSVLHNGIVIPPGAPLPSAEDLAGTDQAALDAAEDQLAVEETRLAQRRSRLAQQRKAADEAAKLEAEQQKKQQAAAEDEETYGTAKHPLSYFDGKTDEQILEEPGIGDAKLHEIKAAQKKAAKGK